MSCSSRGGLFVSFEGVDGAGKSTLIASIAQSLTAQGRSIVSTREPGGTPCAEAIRNILKTFGTQLNIATEALLFAAARADHVQQSILPALAEGKIVVCDRFIDSSLAYQGYGRGGDVGMITILNEWATGGLYPDLTIYLHVPELIAQQRRAKRAEEPTLFDEAGEAFFDRVRDGFNQLFIQRKNVLVLDATAPVADLVKQTTHVIEQAYARKSNCCE